MTIKLSAYGIRGPWVVDICGVCGRTRKCIQWKIPDGPDGYSLEAECLVCLVKDIEGREREKARYPRGVY
jgi:hypothetical protein